MSASEQLYGFDQNGFVWGFVFRPGEAAQSVTAIIATSMLAENSHGFWAVIFLIAMLTSALGVIVVKQRKD